MARLLLLRHLKSQWNQENRFTGWVDVGLAQSAFQEVKKAARHLAKIRIDKIYTSPLARNQFTAALVCHYLKKKHIFCHLDKGRMKKWGHFKEIRKDYIPIYVSEKLNERYYGKLQGRKKELIIKKFGGEKVRLWRRSYEIAPPGGESLEDVVKRVAPFFKKFIQSDLKRKLNILLVASHNSLRAIIKELEKISDKDIINIELTFGALIEYVLSKEIEIKNKKIYSFN